MFLKNMRMSYLLDFYGDLLTERQKEFYDLYYNEDLSLAEIAENYGITRQGVRDVIDIGASEENADKVRGKKRGKSEALEKSSKLSAKERESLIERLTREMKDAARQLEFEKAAWLRDEIARLKSGK